MVGELGIEPLVYCCNQRRIRRLVNQFTAICDLFINNGDMPGGCGSKLGKPRHILTVDVGRSREITFKELLADIFQMLAHQPYLGRIRRLFGHDPLNAPLRILGKDMRRGGQTERHYVFAASRHLVLALRISHGRHMGGMIHLDMVDGGMSRCLSLDVSDNGQQRN